LQLVHQFRGPQLQFIRVWIFERVLILRPANPVIDAEILNGLEVDRNSLNFGKLVLQPADYLLNVSFALCQRL
jgi:hypothetical protein